MRDPLDAAALSAALDRLDGWTGDETSLRRTATLPSFRDAITAVDRIADVAEELDHHPDIDIRWRRLAFVCSTHSAGNRVTELDVELAARIDGILADLGGTRG
jgi:4a-hydroxytetrahydrobiopterin dehydratase